MGHRRYRHRAGLAAIRYHFRRDSRKYSFYCKNTPRSSTSFAAREPSEEREKEATDAPIGRHAERTEQEPHERPGQLRRRRPVQHGRRLERQTVRREAAEKGNVVANGFRITSS